MKRKVKINLKVGGFSSHSTRMLINFIIEKQEAFGLFNNFQLCHSTLPDCLVYWFRHNGLPADMGNPHCCPYFTIKTVLWKKEKPESL